MQALYGMPRFFASIFTFFSTRGSNFTVTGVSLGLSNLSSDS